MEEGSLDPGIMGVGKEFARMYDAGMGMIIFAPVAFVVVPIYDHFPISSSLQPSI